jgi:3-deoxy-D-manno-octulosonate 8-phosphate phosphatase (KDO 8-P phosphatase)
LTLSEASQKLLNLSPEELKLIKSKIKIIAFDIDGTLTDGSIYMGELGEVFKVFNAKDGYGIRKAEAQGLKIYFITAREASGGVYKRIEDWNLPASRIRDKSRNKINCAEKILAENNCTFEDFAFMGDDIPDLELLKKSVFSACPADAVSEIQSKVNFITKLNGGKGAAREFIDLILEKD